MVLSCRALPKGRIDESTQVRASAEEAAKLAADTSKMVVETESQGLTRLCDGRRCFLSR